MEIGLENIIDVEIMSKRIKTDYPGVFYRIAKRLGGAGTERVYYVVYKRDGKVIEDKVGRQYKNHMTPAKASTERGKRIEGKKSNREKREADKAKKEAENGRWTISRLWSEYKTNRPGLKGLVTDENRFKKYIEPEFGNKEPSGLLPLDIDRLRIKLLKNKRKRVPQKGKVTQLPPLKPGTVKNILELLRRIIQFGVKKNLCWGLNFTIEMPKVNNTKTEDLTTEQFSNLLRAIDKDTNIQAANMMRLVLYTGMRRGELFKLKWSDINFQREFINIRNPKGGLDQKIPLNDGAKKVLENHPRTDSQFIFPGRGGKQRTDIKHQVNRIKKEAGLPQDFRALHGLRHVYASMLASSGKVDMYTLQKLLTHKSPAMTQRYAHLRDETLKNASNVANDIILQATKKKKDKVVGIKK